MLELSAKTNLLGKMTAIIPFRMLKDSAVGHI